MEYGYTRTSRPTQNIERQVRNILAVYPKAHIIREVYTRTSFNRKEWTKLMKTIKPGDTIIFDSVSRMSGDAVEGVNVYEALFEKGVKLVFLREPYINTDTYRAAISEQISLVGDEIADEYIKTTNRVLIILAKKQVKQAFEQSEKEVTDLHQRTKEGIETARLNGKQIGMEKGTKLVTKKSIAAKEGIKKYSVDFGGTLSDPDVIKLVGVSRNTYYKYKRELFAAAESQDTGRE